MMTQDVFMHGDSFTFEKVRAACCWRRRYVRVPWGRGGKLRDGPDRARRTINVGKVGKDRGEPRPSAGGQTDAGGAGGDVSRAARAVNRPA
jgi:hypothetical protein